MFESSFGPQAVNLQSFEQSCFFSFQEFRLYAVDPAGNFADETFDFHSDGRMSSAFEGWIRLAEVQAPEDRAILDFHAPAVLVDWQLDVEHGGAVKWLGRFLAVNRRAKLGPGIGICVFRSPSSNDTGHIMKQHLDEVGIRLNQVGVRVSFTVFLV